MLWIIGAVYLWNESKDNKRNFIANKVVDIDMFTPFVYAILAGMFARIFDSDYDSRVLLQSQDMCYRSPKPTELHMYQVWFL